jgi:hypothetical protein
MALLRRPAVSFALTLLATGVALWSSVTIVAGSQTSGWSHWLCSPAALRSAAHAVSSSGLGAGVLTALELHWAHFLPVLAGLATLVYLWRADARYRSQDSHSVPAVRFGE